MNKKLTNIKVSCCC